MEKIIYNMIIRSVLNVRLADQVTYVTFKEVARYSTISYTTPL